MTLPEIPPAHREAVAAHITDYLQLLSANVASAFAGAMAEATMAEMLRLGYRVAPGWVAVDADDTATWPPDDSAWIIASTNENGDRCPMLIEASFARRWCLAGLLEAWQPFHPFTPPPSATNLERDDSTAPKGIA